MNRRRFCRSGLLFVPTLFAIGQVRGQSGFLGQVRNALLNGLLAYWKFDESASGSNTADATGNSWTGVNQGTTSFSSALINNGANMAGGGQGFSVPAAVMSNHPTNQSFSVQCWCKGPTSGNNSAIMGQVLPNVYWDVFYLTTGNQLGFQVHDNSNTNFQIASTNNLTAAGWHQVCAGFDAGNSLIWIQADLETRQTIGGVTSVKRTSDQVVALGNYSNFSLAYGNQIDEFGLWNRVLSITDVTFLNNSGLGRPFSQFD